MNISDFRSRVIVSGAPGETHELSYIGYAGGLIRQNGISIDGSDCVIGEGANQSSGGKGQFDGEFGIGANSTPGFYTDTAGAGGSGWYGGGSGYHSDDRSSGGGRSSYISGFEGCENISYDWRFENTIMFNGSQQFMEPDGNISTFGPKGSGFCIITCIEAFISCEHLCFYQNNILILFIYVFVLLMPS
ncbi:glycine-rich protein family [Trichomonas vaginalis G3]|uniref:glycine-rich protein family n=1 Tax=Trichomonas vaginalis (strain ATCC PRA-98 / G3) TaxID=412133 RepID=UPI0021E5B812|nr:glycine-rich protein family [Trichomonas vaginalis G3]KAI5505031.1 glycine-rich protein family [Trichomonas vaginalis G3]